MVCTTLGVYNYVSKVRQKHDVKCYIDICEFYCFAFLDNTLAEKNFVRLSEWLSKKWQNNVFVF